VLQGRTFASLNLSTPKAEPAAPEKGKEQKRRRVILSSA